MKKLRLLVTSVCDKDCSGCCNKDWGLSALPSISADSPELLIYDEILLTGGEPLLALATVRDIINKVNGQVPVYIYTASHDTIALAFAYLESDTIFPFLTFCIFSDITVVVFIWESNFPCIFVLSYYCCYF